MNIIKCQRNIYRLKHHFFLLQHQLKSLQPCVRRTRLPSCRSETVLQVALTTYPAKTRRFIPTSRSAALTVSSGEGSCSCACLIMVKHHVCDTCNKMLFCLSGTWRVATSLSQWRGSISSLPTPPPPTRMMKRRAQRTTCKCLRIPTQACTIYLSVYSPGY